MSKQNKHFHLFFCHVVRLYSNNNKPSILLQVGSRDHVVRLSFPKEKKEKDIPQERNGLAQLLPTSVIVYLVMKREWSLNGESTQ